LLPAFEVASNEILNPESTEQAGQLSNTGYDGYGHAVALIDADNDGDLDLMVGESGSLGGVSSFGGLNAFYENRVVGAGFNARTNSGFVRVPGGGVVTNPSLAVTMVSPSYGHQGEDLAIRLFGRGFRTNLSVYFGPGVQILTAPVVRSTSIVDLTIRITPYAELGPRSVAVYNPNGESATTELGGFVILTADTGSTGQTPPVESGLGAQWPLYD